jgi:hypothetical protein
MLWTAPRRVESWSLVQCPPARRVGRHRLSSVIRPSHLGMSTPPHSLPEWFVHGERLLWPTLALARSAVGQRKGGDLTLDVIPECAAIHLIHCIDTSSQVNRKGRHAVAISLVRQCVEAITLVELGLRDPAYRDPLLGDWRDEKKSQGQLRKALERDVWPSYGSGLRSESWAEFAAEFAQAVQPYAHYTSLLQGWQMAVASGDQLRRSPDGNLLFVAQIGMDTYDGVKATRITLLHCLITWAVGRILMANGVQGVDASAIQHLGGEMARSELLGAGNLTWHQEFWPHMFDNPNRGG